MFYTPCVAYDHLPTAAQVQTLRDRGYRVFMYQAGTPDRAFSLTEMTSDPDVTR